ncbi:hypothetical protein Poly51_61860 [Rubripirellula tenax]|uniref:Uncharacterized protein n=2 Tax=Rubripirellula tenax TaxID=2528015 RepID=A0A5C6E9Q3_9BACT|nr:hypothetical protein Poly51_61860 [Rubripirellula tenax]
MTTVAAATLVLLIHFSMTSVSLADVAQAVSRKPWIHMTLRGTAKGTAEREEEVWYSPIRNVSATRHNEWTKFSDHTLRVFYSYEATERVLYRVPEFDKGQQSRLADFVEAFSLLLANGSAPDDPLAKLEFLGERRDGLTVENQKTQKVTETGREWLDYTLTLIIQGMEQPIKVLFRVDPISKLPHLGRATGQQNGQSFSMEATFDYPETGPEDIYAMGVPRDAKLVDRVPKDDLARLIAGVAAGRVRFDDFRAVVVHTHGKGPSWRNHQVEVVHRKGNRIRRDFGFFEVDPVEPPQDADMRKWWTGRAKEAQYQPASIAIAGVERMFDVRTINQPDGSQRREAVAGRPLGTGIDAEQWIPSFYTLTPDYAGRPPLGVPSQNKEAIIEPDRGDGPEGTVLLRVATSGRSDSASNPADNKKRALPGGWRFWIDPDREHLVMRWDMHGMSHIVESVAQSPKGRWYPTRVRRTSSRPKAGDDITEFYVEFDVEIPDALFDLEKPLPVEELFPKSK